jgi:hypothetical protein
LGSSTFKTHIDYSYNKLLRKLTTVKYAQISNLANLTLCHVNLVNTKHARAVGNNISKLESTICNLMVKYIVCFVIMKACLISSLLSKHLVMMKMSNGSN